VAIDESQLNAAFDDFINKVNINPVFEAEQLLVKACIDWANASVGHSGWDDDYIANIYQLTKTVIEARDVSAISELV
jgi:hypothetical protein